MPPIARKSCLRDEILMRRRGVRGFKCERTARTVEVVRKDGPRDRGRAKELPARL